MGLPIYIGFWGFKITRISDDLSFVMTNQALVSTIVLNWNGKNVISECLESLLTQTYRPHEIIVVDNGSTDGSLAMIRAKYGSLLKIVTNERNLGFAEGVNCGVRSSKGDLIAILNSDAAAQKDWIEELARSMSQSESVGMCASKIYLAGQAGILDNTGEVICRDGLGRGRGRLEKDQGQYDSSPEVLCPSGCAALYRRKMLEEAGGMDKYFFAYAEDIDIGLRGRLIGYDCVYVPSAVVIHKFSHSSGLVSPLKAFYVERNRLWVVLKCFPLPHLLLAPFYTVQRYFYHLAGLFSKKGPASQYVDRFSPWSLFLILIKVYLSTLWFLPYLIIQRGKIRKKSKRTWQEFERWLRSFGMSSRDAALNELG